MTAVFTSSAPSKECTKFSSKSRWVQYRWIALFCVCAQLFWALRLQLDSSLSASGPSWDRKLMEDSLNQPTTLQNPQTKVEPVQILFCLHGGKSYFIDEWEVALKSVLLNAPLDAPLNIHIIANNDAFYSVQQRLQKHDLIGSTWRQPITITAYHVEDRREEFEQLLTKALRGNALDSRVSLGGYYRLLAPMVIPKEVGPVLYMDVDAVILSNLQDLWRNVNSTYVFQGSTTWLCSAFIIINLEKAGIFWELLDKVPVIDWGGDQALLVYVTEANPEILGPLPPSWDIHLGHGFREKPQKVYTERDGAGMLHFNGKRPNFFHQGLMEYCNRAESCSRNKKNKATFEKTWMLADYYVQLPWHWAKYMGQSQIIPGTEGHPLAYHQVIQKSTLPEEEQAALRQKRIEETLSKHFKTATGGSSTEKIQDVWPKTKLDTQAGAASKKGAITAAESSKERTRGNMINKKDNKGGVASKKPVKKDRAALIREAFLRQNVTGTANDAKLRAALKRAENRSSPSRPVVVSPERLYQGRRWFAKVSEDQKASDDEGAEDKNDVLGDDEAASKTTKDQEVEKRPKKDIEEAKRQSTPATVNAVNQESKRTKAKVNESNVQGKDDRRDTFAATKGINAESVIARNKANNGVSSHNGDVSSKQSPAKVIQKAGGEDPRIKLQ